MTSIHRSRADLRVSSHDLYQANLTVVIYIEERQMMIQSSALFGTYFSPETISSADHVRWFSWLSQDGIESAFVTSDMRIQGERLVSHLESGPVLGECLEPYGARPWDKALDLNSLQSDTSSNSLDDED